MQRIVLFIIVILLCISGKVSAQQQEASRNFYDLKAEREVYYDSLIAANVDLNEEWTAYNQYQEWVRYWEPLTAPSGDMNEASNKLYQLFTARMNGTIAELFTASQNCNWQELGIDEQPLESVGAVSQQGTGRVQFITVDPANSNRIFTGSPKGGLFVSTDRGASWESDGTDQGLPVTGVSDFKLTYLNNKEYHFIATGDGEGFEGTEWNPSMGIFRRIDNGTWEQIGTGAAMGAIDGNGNYWLGWQIKKILLDPSDVNTMYAATSFGLFKSSNVLAEPYTNVSWSKLPTRLGEWDNGDVYDVEFRPNNPFTNTLDPYDICVPCSRIVASGRFNTPAGSPLVYSTDFGQTWNPIAGCPFNNNANVLRVSVEFSESNPDIMYCLVITPPLVIDGPDQGQLWRYNFSSQAWTDKGTIDVERRRGQAFGVSGRNSDLVYIGNVTISRCTTATDDNPCTFQNVHNRDIHDDIHGVRFFQTDAQNPATEILMLATDGGVFQSQTFAAPAAGGVAWQPRNTGLGVATIEDFAHSEQDENIYLLSNYDNGSNIHRNNVWTHVKAGDGFGAQINHKNDDNMWTAFQSGSWGRSTNNGATFPDFTFGSNPDANDILIDCGVDGNNLPIRLPINCGANFATNAVLNAVNPDSIYFGCREVELFDPVSSQIFQKSCFNANLPSNLRSYLAKLSTCAHNSDYLYTLNYEYQAANTAIGSTKAYYTRNVNVNSPVWINITPPTGNKPTGICANPEKPDKIYVTCSGLESGKVYMYDNGAWTNITHNIAGLIDDGFINPSSIHYEIGSNEGIYIGTNAGVFYTNKAMLASSDPSKWKDFTCNLPWVDVKNLKINYHANLLRAGTHGRGLWQTGLYCPDESSLTLSGTSPSAFFYETQNNISSTQDISSDVNIDYRAGKEIHLSDGFGASTSGYFHAFIHPCNHSGNSFSARNSQVNDAETRINQIINERMKKEPENSKFSFNCFPNPFDNELNVTFNLDTDANIEVVLYNQMGQVIERLASGRYPQGEHTLLLRQSPADGVYFLRFEKDGESTMKPVVKTAGW